MYVDNEDERKNEEEMETVSETKGTKQEQDGSTERKYFDLLGIFLYIMY